MIWIIVIFPLIFVFVNWSGKVRFYQMKRGEGMYKAVVMEYRKERMSMNSDETKIPYPYVQIEGFNSPLTKLKYASSGSKPFEIGERIDVFFNEGVLYYWNAYENGWLKFLPAKWDFWNKNKSINA